MFTELLYRLQQRLVAARVNLLIVCCISFCEILYSEHAKFVERLWKGHPEGTAFRTLLFSSALMSCLVTFWGFWKQGERMREEHLKSEDVSLLTRPLTWSYMTPGRI